MKGLELLNALIDSKQEEYDIAEVQTMNVDCAKYWCKDMQKAARTLKVLNAIKEGFLEELSDAKTKAVKLAYMDLPSIYEGIGKSKARVCWSNYRCMLLLNSQTMMIDPFFWTPELGIDNSHYALMMYAERNYCDNGRPIHNIDYHWGGFYTYGLGNGDQKQLTLYGESSDYRHNEYSEAVKEAFLKGEQFFPILVERSDDLPF